MAAAVSGDSSGRIGTDMVPAESGRQLRQGRNGDGYSNVRRVAQKGINWYG
jgi:hypothetical protein